MSKSKHDKTVPGVDDIEILDVSGTAKNVMSRFQQICKDVAKEPVAKQVALGSASGWVVGYLSMKVGKAAATVIGGSLILMQLASHKGYIQVDWTRVNSDLEKNAKKLQKEIKSQVVGTGKKDSVLLFVRENVVLASCFAGGVLLGMASA